MTAGWPTEHRLVTALFADLSGFTSLAERLDADTLHEVIAPLIARLAAVAERYSGFVAKYAGDALLVFFGAPVALEDHATRALLVALEMHDELRWMLPTLAPEAGELALHIGVNTGRVVAGGFGAIATPDYSILGDAVNVAQRLEAATPSGETFVGESTFRLAASLFEFVPVGALPVKGKDQPVPAWRLGGRRSTSESTDAARHGSPSLVGRERELAALSARVDAMASGDCGQGHGFAAIVGEPGIGKSRLLHETRRIAEGRGMRWLETRAVSYGEGLTYEPYADLLRRFLGIQRDHDPEIARYRLRTLVGPDTSPVAIAALGRMLGLPPDEAHVVDPESFRGALHRAFRMWLGLLAADQPTVLAIEDVHWADKASVALTADLAAYTQEVLLLLLVTARPEGAGIVETLAAASGVDAAVVHPDSLTRTHIDDLVDALLEAEAPAVLHELVVDRAGGNPLFVEELVRALIDSGRLVRRGDRVELSLEADIALLPPTVEGILSARIDALPKEAQILLQRSSVIGRRVPRPLLRAVSSDIGDFDTALGALTVGQFLDDAPEDPAVVVFHHALVQDVAYARLLRRDRRALHLRVAEAGEALYGARDATIDLLARHYWLADAGPRALPYLHRAADRARALFANDEAIVLLERAREIAAESATDEERSELLLALADVYELRGDYDDAWRLYAMVRDDTGDVRAWRGLAATMRRRGRLDEALLLLEDAFARLTAGSEMAALWLERGWVLSLVGRLNEGIAALEAGYAQCGADAGPIAGQLLVELARVNEEAGRIDAAIEHALAARVVFEDLGDLRGVLVATRVVGGAYNVGDRPDDAKRELQEGLALAERIGDPEQIGACLINLGFLHERLGDIGAGIDCDRRALAHFEGIDHAMGRATANVNLGGKLAIAGDLQVAEAHCERAIAEARAIGRPFLVADATRTIAEIRLSEKRFDDAVAYANQAAAIFEACEASAEAAHATELAVRAEALALDASS